MRERDYDPCGCVNCSATCTGTPGAYDPAHIQRLLDEGVVTMTELAPTMAEHYSLSGPPVLILRPRTVDEKPGAQVPFLTLPGKCVHLGEKGCTLPREHVPIVCISSYCCTDGPGVGKMHFDKGHLRDPWTSAVGRNVLRLFEEESARQNPGVELGLKALDEQMHRVWRTEHMQFNQRAERLRWDMKEEVHIARTLELVGSNGVPCQNCKNTASVTCDHCDRLVFCSDTCAGVGGPSGHPSLCVHVEKEREALVQWREELLWMGCD